MILVGGRLSEYPRHVASRGAPSLIFGTGEIRSMGRLGVRKLVSMSLAVFASLGSLGSAAAAEGWRAGTARVAITPKQPTWMAGYGSRNKPSEGAVHDLWAKALVLE